MEAIRVHLPEDLRMNDSAFVRFCQENPDLKFERRKNGDIVYMPLFGGEMGALNAEIMADLGTWNRRAKYFVCFGSSTAFRLPDTSIMSPDGAAVSRSRWERLTNQEKTEKDSFNLPRFCARTALGYRPAERRQRKMADWMANGCQLGWLIDPANQTTYIYRPAQEPEIVTGLGILSGELVLPGFELDLALLG